MDSTVNFDRLTRVYQALEYLAWGRSLEQARFAHLSRLAQRRSILVLGEGDGRCLERLLPAAPQAHIDCWDISPGMLARAAGRIQGKPGAERVSFHQADLGSAPLPRARYDAVITFFFLDCFTTTQAHAVMSRIRDSLQPGAIWLWADFVLPPGGWRRLRARVWLAVLYAFFRWQTGLSVRALPAVDDFFRENHFVRATDRSWQSGFIRSTAWQQTSPEQTPPEA
ncbi:MAG: class I SAM-dependent methyltransferase [Opitutales bacterium]